MVGAASLKGTAVEEAGMVMSIVVVAIVVVKWFVGLEIYGLVLIDQSKFKPITI
jgi:hypothetical protein